MLRFVISALVVAMFTGLSCAGEYGSAYQKACELDVPLIVYVAPAGPSVIAASDRLFCRVDKLEGYSAGDIVVSSPFVNASGVKRLAWHSTVRDEKEIVLPSASDGAFEQLNRQRAARWLPPYVRDDGLMAAAKRAADYRAHNLMFGHTADDFSFLGGAQSNCAGCAAYPREDGFMACACYENWTYAGAAWTKGVDGKMYCHLFVR